jgi:polysaccharide export outer membrane protein
MRERISLVAMIATGLAAGCASKDTAAINNWLMAYTESSSSIDYRVGIPDAISITAPRIPEIDGELQNIQPDGKVTLRLLGEVRIDGMTAKEIAAKLTMLLREYYEEPKVQVRIAAYRSKKIYVFGQIGQGSGGGGGGVTISGTRAIPYTGRNTLLDVLTETGMSFIAWRSNIKVIRANPDDERRHVITVDMDKMATTGDTSLNVLLEPGDIVYVPPTPLGWLGLRIQEVLFPLNPVLNAYMFPATVMAATDVYRD